MALSTTRTGANGPIGSRQSLRHSLSCDPKPSKPHSTIPKHKCRAVSVAGLPRRLPAGTSAWLWCSTESSTCCRLGIGSCLALSFALSWDIRRNSFLGFQDVLKGFSFFCSPLTTPSPILLESMGQAPPLPYTDWLDSAAYSPDPRHPQGGGKPRPYIYSGCAEAYAPAAAWIFPLNGLAITGDVACSALEAMFIREVHFSSEQFKQTRGAHVDAGSCIAS